MARLENWVLFPSGCLHGNVFDHPRFIDGDEVTTSRVIACVPGERAETRNTSYTLGAPLDMLDSTSECVPYAGEGA